jgi:hypothetical protein
VLFNFPISLSSPQSIFRISTDFRFSFQKIFDFWGEDREIGKFREFEIYYYGERIFKMSEKNEKYYYLK